MAQQYLLINVQNLNARIEKYMRIFFGVAEKCRQIGRKNVDKIGRKNVDKIDRKNVDTFSFRKNVDKLFDRPYLCRQHCRHFYG